MEPEPGLILKNMSGSEYLNSQTKFEFAFKFLHIKLLGNGIQEKLYFNNIVTIKSTFLAN